MLTNEFHNNGEYGSFVGLRKERSQSGPRSALVKIEKFFKMSNRCETYFRILGLWVTRNQVGAVFLNLRWNEVILLQSATDAIGWGA